MTKKDYELIAFTIYNLRGIGQENKSYVAVRFATELERDNPRFDRDKFLTACGIEV